MTMSFKSMLLIVNSLSCPKNLYFPMWELTVGQLKPAVTTIPDGF